MQLQEVIELAEAIGFSHVSEVHMEALQPLPEIREMCRADKCNRFGKSWSCPPSPACLDMKRTAERIQSYSFGLLVQTTGRMEDAFDLEVIRETERIQKRYFDTLVRQLRLLKQQGRLQDCMPLGSGSCTRCPKCTYPDHPCRYPDKLYPSMEAYGLWVSDVCEKSGMKYNYGENTITFTACVLCK